MSISIRDKNNNLVSVAHDGANGQRNISRPILAALYGHMFLVSAADDLEQSTSLTSGYVPVTTDIFDWDEADMNPRYLRLPVNNFKGVSMVNKQTIGAPAYFRLYLWLHGVGASDLIKVLDVEIATGSKFVATPYPTSVGALPNAIHQVSAILAPAKWIVFEIEPKTSPPAGSDDFTFYTARD